MNEELKNYSDEMKAGLLDQMRILQNVPVPALPSLPKVIQRLLCLEVFLVRSNPIRCNFMLGSC